VNRPADVTSTSTGRPVVLSQRLARYIEAIDISEASPSAPGGDSYTVLPTPQPVLGLQRRGRLAALHGERAWPLETVGLTGLQSSARRFLAEPGTCTLLVRFKPYGAAPFVGARIGDVVDQHVGLSQIVSPAFAQALIAQTAADASDEDATRTLLTALEALLQHPQFSVPASVRQAADTLVREGGAVRIAALAERLGVGVRRLERGFHACIGLSPNEFAGIVRFTAAVERLDAPVSAARAAHDAGFADQAQFSREFARRTGSSPARWRRTH
jgi:AraC-like DNA-binding protein